MQLLRGALCERYARQPGEARCRTRSYALLADAQRDTGPNGKRDATGGTPQVTAIGLADVVWSGVRCAALTGQCHMGSATGTEAAWRGARRLYKQTANFRTCN